jgi:uncharacterized protein
LTAREAAGKIAALKSTPPDGISSAIPPGAGHLREKEAPVARGRGRVSSIRIELSDIREGVNRFAFRVGPEEIGLEEEGAVYRKPVDVDIEITRTGGTLTVRGSARTEVERICGRCLSAFTEDETLPFDDAWKVEGDRVRVYDVDYEGDPGYLAGPAGAVVLDEMVREAVLVHSPMQPVCRPECRGLCPVCGADRNEGECGCRVEPGHEAWQALRDLVRNQEKRK